MQPPCGDLQSTSWIFAFTSLLLSSKKLETSSSLVVLMSQTLESLFEEKPINLIMFEDADGFDESSPLVPLYSSLLREVEQLGSSLDDFMLLKEWSSTSLGHNPYLQ